MKFKDYQSIYKDKVNNIYEYRDIYFSFYGEAFRLLSGESTESFRLSRYLDDKIDLTSKNDKEGYSSPEYNLGYNLDEVKKTIDNYYIDKEANKFGL